MHTYESLAIAGYFECLDDTVTTAYGRIPTEERNRWAAWGARLET
jgi:hypothetical protein